MRKYLAWIGAALVLGAAGPARAQDAVRATIERAVRAHGGRDRLANFRPERVKMRGTVLIKKDQPATMTAEMTLQLPSRLRVVVRMKVGDREHTLIQLLDGDKVALYIDGLVQKPAAEAVAELRDTLRIARAVRLVPLLTDKKYQLAGLPDIKVNDRPAAGVKVSGNGLKELRLYFDKETGLLVKTEHPHAGGGQEVRQEEYYGNFKDLGGYRRPTRTVIFRAGTKMAEKEVLEVKRPEEVEEREFTKP